jgi:hypothetical protein
MIVGTPSRFALEFEIGKAYSDRRFMAAGCFRVHINGQIYGRGGSNSTSLCYSLEDINQRMTSPGHRTCTLIAEADPTEAAEAWVQARFSTSPPARVLGVPSTDFVRMIIEQNIQFAGNDDPTWDDGSVVFQCDVEARVRLIAFRKRRTNGPLVDAVTDLWLPAQEFYTTLTSWRDALEAQWRRTPKV